MKWEITAIHYETQTLQVVAKTLDGDLAEITFADIAAWQVVDELHWGPALMAAEQETYIFDRLLASVKNSQYRDNFLKFDPYLPYDRSQLLAFQVSTMTEVVEVLTPTQPSVKAANREADA